MRIILYATLALMFPAIMWAQEDQLLPSVGEVSARIPSSPIPKKSNGIFLTLGSDTYLVTVGHEFEFTTKSIELLTNSGDTLRGVLQTAYYNEADPEGTDVAVVKADKSGAFTSNYIWQSGSLIERFALPGTKVRIYNGRETIDGYEVAGSPSPTTVNLGATIQGRVLQGMSGSIVASNGMVIGIVRDVSHEGLIQVLRIDVVSRLIEKNLPPLPCGDAIVLSNWAEGALSKGDFETAKGFLGDAKALLDTSPGNNDKVDADVKLTTARYDISQGLIYDADQTLESVLPVYTSLSDWRQQAQTLMLMGKSALIAGYRFEHSSSQNFPGQAIKNEYAQPLQRAVDYFQSAVALLRTKHDPTLLGRALVGHAAALPITEYETALRESSEALTLCRNSSPFDAVRAADLFVELHARLGEPSPPEVARAALLTTKLTEREQAEAWQENSHDVGRSIEIYGRVGSQFELAIAYEKAGDMANDQDAEVAFYKKAFGIFKTDNKWQWFKTRCTVKVASINPRLQLEPYGR